MSKPTIIDKEFSIASGSLRRAIDDPDAVRAIVTIAFPGLWEMNDETSLFGASSVEFAIAILCGDQVYAERTFRINGKISISNSYKREYSFRLPTARPLAIQVRRITPDSTRVGLLNKTEWYSLATENQAEMDHAHLLNKLYGEIKNV